MLFKESRAILYIHKNGITFYADGLPPGLQFEYDENLVDDNTEIVKPEKLQAQLATFLKDNDIKPYTAILLLSEEVVMQTTISADDVHEQKTAAQKFLDEAPFKEKTSMVYRMDGVVQVIATNKNLYDSIAILLIQYGWKVEAVVPIRLFGDYEVNNILTKENINDILSQRKILKEGNLLGSNVTTDFSKATSAKEEEAEDEKEEKHRKTDDDEEKKSDKEDNEEKEEAELKTEKEEHKDSSVESLFARDDTVGYDTQDRDKKGVSKKLLIGLVLAGFIVGLVILFLMQPKKFAALGLGPTPTPSPTETPMPTPTPATVSKDQLTVQVLNGTGTVGQAGKVKTAVEGLGYKTVDTGNGSTTDNTTTTVVFDNKVAQSDQDELVTELKKTFKTVTSSTASGSQSHDIVITTGAEK